MSNLGIVTNGLVYHIDDMNPYCFRGENTTNLFGPSETGTFPVQVFGFTRIANGKYGDYDIKPTDYVYKYDLGVAGCHYHGYDMTVISGAFYNFSFDYYISPSVTLFPTNNFLADLENAGAGSVTTNGVSDIGKWNSKNILDDTNDVTLRALLYPGACASSYLASSGFILYKNPQVEQKTYRTPFVSGSRTNRVSGGGGLRDLTVNRNHVDLTGSMAKVSFSCSLYRNGVDSDTSFYFSGSNTLVNSSRSIDHITISSSFNGDLLHNMMKGSFTLECWYYPYSNPATREDTSQRSHALIMRPGVHSGLRWDGSDIWFDLWTEVAGTDGNTSTVVSAGKSGITTLNKWYHVVGVRDATNKFLKVYVNGIEGDTSSTHTSLNRTSGVYTSNIPWKIGAAANNVTLGNYAWKADGRIPQVRMYNRSLTKGEILRNFMSTKTRYGV